MASPLTLTIPVTAVTTTIKTPIGSTVGYVKRFNRTMEGGVCIVKHRLADLLEQAI